MAIQPPFNPFNDPVPNPLLAVDLQTGFVTFEAFVEVVGESAARSASP